MVLHEKMAVMQLLPLIK